MGRRRELRVVVAFLFADLNVLPQLDIYRRYYGWRMALYMGVVFYTAMSVAALVVDLGFTPLGLVPHATGGIKARVSHFESNYTFWLKLASLALAIWLFALNRHHPMNHGTAIPIAGAGARAEPDSDANQSTY